LGLAAVPQLLNRPGGLSVHDVWHEAVNDCALQAGGATPPLSVSVPQHFVPVGHWLVPVFPPQSMAYVPALHVAWQLDAKVVGLPQQFCPAAHE
jgi:hypothetical protein